MNQLRNITLLVAQSCNLHCRYCYAQGGDYGGSRRSMTMPTLQRALEVLLPLTAPRVTLSFFGGEPLLNLPFMRRAVTQARRFGEKAGREIRFALTTNGTLLDESAIEFIREHIGSLAVSLDGEAAVNDDARRFRRGSESVHRRVMESLERLRAAGVSFALRATLTPANAPYIVSSARHLVAQGPEMLRMLPDFSDDWSAESLAVLTKGFAAIHQDALDHTLSGGSPYGAEALYPLLEHRLQGKVREYPCEAGVAMVAVAADGAVYPCDHFVGRSDYCMGRVSEPGFPGPGFGQVQQRLATKMQASRAGCEHCPVNALCGGECPAVISPGREGERAFCHYKQETLADLQVRIDKLSPGGVLPDTIGRLVE